MILEQFSVTQVFCGVLLVFLSLYWWSSRRKKYNLPPGPWGVPIFGYFPFIGKEPHKTFYELSKMYGKVFSIKMGSSLVIVLNDFDSIKEAFNNSSIQDRPDDFFAILPDRIGFGTLNGAEWVDQRRHTMKVMKELGLTKSSWNSLLEEEINDFVNLVEASAGKPVDILKPLSASVSNNITSLVIAKKVPVGDPIRELIDKWVDTIIKTGSVTSLSIIFPRLTKFLQNVGLEIIAKEDTKTFADFNGYLRKLVSERKNELQDGDEDSFINGYLKEMEKHASDSKSSFTIGNLCGNSQALVAGGSDTTRISILWLLLIMAEFRDIQSKVQAEIDTVLGKDGKASWLEKAKLPYTYATVLEAQRWATIVPIGVIHRASEDTKIAGYDIPKDAGVISNIWAVHYDPKYWKEPEKFRPERFLTSDGSLMLQKPEGYLPFSLGRRSCPGEIVALIEIFQYFTALMQRFKVQPPPGERPDFTGVVEATYHPKPQKLVFVVRD